MESYSFSYNYSANAVLINSHYDPIDAFTISINMYTGQIIVYGYDIYGNQYILFKGFITDFKGDIDGYVINYAGNETYIGEVPSGLSFVPALPVYTVVPYGAYLLYASTTGATPTNA